MIREGVIRLLKEHLEVEDVPLNVPPKPEMGDFSSAICLSLAKQREETSHGDCQGGREIVTIEPSSVCP